MKRIITIVFILMASFSFAQEWQEIDGFYEYLEEFNLEIEAWFNTESGVLNFEDLFSEEPQEVIYHLTFAFAAMEFYLEDYNLSYKELGVEKVYYSYYVIFNENESRYHEDQLRWDLDFDKKWLDKYFQASRREKEELLFHEFSKSLEKFLIRYRIESERRQK